MQKSLKLLLSSIVAFAIIVPAQVTFAAGTGFQFITPPFPPVTNGSGSGNGAGGSSGSGNSSSGSGGYGQDIVGSDYTPPPSSGMNSCIDAVKLQELNNKMHEASSLTISLPKEIDQLTPKVEQCKTELADIAQRLASCQSDGGFCSAIADEHTKKSAECNALSADLKDLQSRYELAVNDQKAARAQINAMYAACGLPTYADPVTGDIVGQQEDPCGVIAICTQGQYSLTDCQQDPFLSCIKSKLSHMMPLSQYQCPDVTSSWQAAHDTCVAEANQGGGLF